MYVKSKLIWLCRFFTKNLKKKTLFIRDPNDPLRLTVDAITNVSELHPLGMKFYLFPEGNCSFESFYKNLISKWKVGKNRIKIKTVAVIPP